MVWLLVLGLVCVMWVGCDCVGWELVIGVFIVLVLLLHS